MFEFKFESVGDGAELFGVFAPQVGQQAMALHDVAPERIWFGDFGRDTYFVRRHAGALRNDIQQSRECTGG